VHGQGKKSSRTEPLPKGELRAMGARYGDLAVKRQPYRATMTKTGVKFKHGIGLAIGFCEPHL